MADFKLKVFLVLCPIYGQRVAKNCCRHGHERYFAHLCRIGGMGMGGGFC